jgi:hypothetical protein
MNARADLPAGEAVVTAAEEASSIVDRRRSFALISYGIVMGPTVTAIGALVSQRWAGAARVASWTIVTTVLAISAVFVAEPGLTILDRCLRPRRYR